MTRPAISIIIPVYNVEKFLRECLDSIFNQTFKDFELICINDGSSDNSLSILNEYAAKDNRINIINQSTAGASVARNKGLDIAKGNYIKFLDADDIFEPELLEDLYLEITKFDADISMCTYKSFNNEISRKFINISNLDFFKHKNTTFNYKDYPEDIFQITQPNIWTKLYKTSFLRATNIRFPLQKSINDLFFTYAVLISAEKIVLLEKPLISYRTNVQTSLTFSAFNQKIENVFTAAKDLYEFLHNNNYIEECKKSYLKRITDSFNHEFNLNKRKEILKGLDILKKNKNMLPKDLFNKIYIDVLKRQFSRASFNIRIKILSEYIQTKYNIIKA